MPRTGFREVCAPILKLLEAIECRDAVLTPEDGEPEWPEADVVTSNTPFPGGKLVGGDYVDALRRLYGSRILGEGRFRPPLVRQGAAAQG